VSDSVRSRRGRDLAEQALVRLVLAYGETPEFVLLGGLVPDLLCRSAVRKHQGTTDVDIQVNLEMLGQSVNSSRMERALRDIDFTPDDQRVWRWRDDSTSEMSVKIEFLADLDDVGDHTTLIFDGCSSLGAMNLRGTGFAARDWTLDSFDAVINRTSTTVRIRVATLPAYLLTKSHAAHGRGLTKDWYDIAFVLLHNDAGGPSEAARLTLERFGPDLIGATETAIDELVAHFATANSQGSLAYSTTMRNLYPELDEDVLANDAVEAVRIFVTELRSTPRQ